MMNTSSPEMTSRLYPMTGREPSCALETPSGVSVPFVWTQNRAEQRRMGAWFEPELAHKKAPEPSKGLQRLSSVRSRTLLDPLHQLSYSRL